MPRVRTMAAETRPFLRDPYFRYASRILGTLAAAAALVAGPIHDMDLHSPLNVMDHRDRGTEGPSQVSWQKPKGGRRRNHIAMVRSRIVHNSARAFTEPDQEQSGSDIPPDCVFGNVGEVGYLTMALALPFTAAAVSYPGLRGFDVVAQTVQTGYHSPHEDYSPAAR